MQIFIIGIIGYQMLLRAEIIFKFINLKVKYYITIITIRRESFSY